MRERGAKCRKVRLSIARVPHLRATSKIRCGRTRHDAALSRAEGRGGQSTELEKRGKCTFWEAASYEPRPHQPCISDKIRGSLVRDRSSGLRFSFPAGQALPGYLLQQYSGLQQPRTPPPCRGAAAVSGWQVTRGFGHSVTPSRCALPCPIWGLSAQAATRQDLVWHLPSSCKLGARWGSSR